MKSTPRQGKPLKRVALLLLLAGTQLKVGLNETWSAPATNTVYQTTGTVVIDGLLSEPCWQKALPVVGDYNDRQPGTPTAERHLAARYTWDPEYFYLAYETFDTNLVAVGKRELQGPPGNRRRGCEIWDARRPVDVVEFFISFGDERFFWEIHHNALNQFNDIWCVVPDPAWPISRTALAPYGILFHDREYIADDGEHTLQTAARLKPKANRHHSTVNYAGDCDTGYTAEIRIPWQGLGAPRERRIWLETAAKKRLPGPWKMAGETMLVLAVMQDGDLPERYHHSSPERKGDWFHKTAPLWPRYLLTTRGDDAGTD